jgi:hypothetical protein
LSDQEITGYFNEMLAGLEELLYHELSGTAHKKVELVGIDFLRSRVIEGKTLEEIIEKCTREIISGGIVRHLKYSIHGFGILLKLEVEGCIHMPKEAKLKRDGAKPYMCPIANMIGDRILEILNYEVAYLANLDIDEDEGTCIVKYAVFENAQKIGQVSDWTKI